MANTIETRRKAISWDLDDVLIGRELITRIGANGLARRKVHAPKIQIYTQNDIPDTPDIPSDKVISSVGERISYEFHKRRKVTQGVLEILQKANDNGIDNYANTGRPNKQEWVVMTQNTLTQGGIAGLLKDTHFTPEQTKTALSKASKIRQLRENYDEVVHIDDDPRTAIILARLFPDMTIYLVSYGTSGLLYSRKEMKKLKNIKRIGKIKKDSMKMALAA